MATPGAAGLLGPTVPEACSGAGFGGMELSTLLSEALGPAADVTVIERGDAFVFGYSKIDVMFGLATPQAVRLHYRNFVKPGVRFVQETITTIDPVARRVTTNGGTHEADFVVIALGADYDLAATPGLAEDGNEFYSVARVSQVREVLPAFSKSAAIVGVSSFPYKCPPAPSKRALMLDAYLTRRGVRGACAGLAPLLEQTLPKIGSTLIAVVPAWLVSTGSGCIPTFAGPLPSSRNRPAVRLVAMASGGSDRGATAGLDLDDRWGKPPSTSTLHSLAPKGISALHFDCPALSWRCSHHTWQPQQRCNGASTFAHPGASHHLGEHQMSLYLTRAKYSPEAFKGMIANPSDREAAGRAMFEAAGIKLHHMWYSGNGEVICIVEGDAVAGSMVGMVTMASGGFISGESTQLITMAQMTEAMKGAGAIVAKFRPPGK